MKRNIGLLLLLAANLSGCAGVNTGMKYLRDHPQHCQLAADVIRAAIQSGQVPGNTPIEELDAILHKAQLGFFVAGMCPAP